MNAVAATTDIRVLAAEIVSENGEEYLTRQRCPHEPGDCDFCDAIRLAQREACQRRREGDFSVEDHGTIFLLRPITDAAREWLDENLDPGANWFGRAVVVEHRYVEAIVAGMIGDGLLAREA